MTPPPHPPFPPETFFYTPAGGQNPPAGGVVIKAGTGNEETGNKETGKRGNDNYYLLIFQHHTLKVHVYLDGFGITEKSVFYRTLLNKERTHSYLEQCNLRHDY